MCKTPLNTMAQDVRSSGAAETAMTTDSKLRKVTTSVMCYHINVVCTPCICGAVPDG